MKFMNTHLLSVTFAEELHETLTQMEKVDTYEAMKPIAYRAQGMVNGMIVFMNTAMRCGLGNDEVECLDILTDKWFADIYEAAAQTAMRLHQPPEVIIKLFDARDEYLEAMKA